MEEIISEKNDLAVGSSSCSNSSVLLVGQIEMTSLMPTLSVLIAQSILSHIGQLYGTLRARIHEPVAALRMKFSSGNDFSQLLHVCWLYVDNVEALILNVEVP